MKRIAIIGGGISGLSAAYNLQKIRRSVAGFEYSLFEAAPRLGGVLVTEQVDGCLVEAGPDSFLTEKPWAAQLCREVGLGDQIIGSNDAQRRTYIVVKNKVIEMPDVAVSLARARLRFGQIPVAERFTGTASKRSARTTAAKQAIAWATVSGSMASTPAPRSRQ